MTTLSASGSKWMLWFGLYHIVEIEYLEFQVDGWIKDRFIHILENEDVLYLEVSCHHPLISIFSHSYVDPPGRSCMHMATPS